MYTLRSLIIINIHARCSPSRLNEQQRLRSFEMRSSDLLALIPIRLLSLIQLGTNYDHSDWSSTLNLDSEPFFRWTARLVYERPFHRRSQPI